MAEDAFQVTHITLNSTGSDEIEISFTVLILVFRLEDVSAWCYYISATALSLVNTLLIKRIDPGSVSGQTTHLVTKIFKLFILYFIYLFFYCFCFVLIWSGSTCWLSTYPGDITLPFKRNAFLYKRQSQ